jgi:hypothetical protein
VHDAHEFVGATSLGFIAFNVRGALRTSGLPCERGPLSVFVSFTHSSPLCPLLPCADHCNCQEHHCAD